MAYTDSMLKVLLVGAGAVGQVYGYHLEQGGASVAFLVRPKYVENCRTGFTLYPLNGGEKVHFKPRILSDVAEVAVENWDQVYLCMSSTGLRGVWLGELIKAVGSATVVSLQPGPEDREYLLKQVSEDRLVSGVIPIISFHAPLSESDAGRFAEPGMAYWFPPFSSVTKPGAMSGPELPTKQAVQALNAGGFPAKKITDVTRSMAFGGAALLILMAVLEKNDWSLKKLLNSPNLSQAVRATKEASVVLEKKFNMKAPLWLHFFRPSNLRILLAVSRKTIPLDLETYLKAHFTKVGDQTRFIIGSYIEDGRRMNLPIEELSALLKCIMHDSI